MAAAKAIRKRRTLLNLRGEEGIPELRRPHRPRCPALERAVEQKEQASWKSGREHRCMNMVADKKKIVFRNHRSLLSSKRITYADRGNQMDIRSVTSEVYC